MTESNSQVKITAPASVGLFPLAAVYQQLYNGRQTPRVSIMSLLLIGFLTTLGIIYFCVDFYRNRQWLTAKADLATDLLYPDMIPTPDQRNLPATEQTLQHLGHAVGEASHSIGHAIEHCVEAIAHTL